MPQTLEPSEKGHDRPSSPALRGIGAEGLGGSFVIAFAALVVGAYVACTGVPGLTVAAVLMLGAEIALGRRNVASDKVVARLTFVGVGGLLGVLAWFKAHQASAMPDIHWAGLAPGVALVLAFVITLSSAFAGSIVDRLRVTGRRLHVTTLVATALSAALVVVGASRARRLPELTRCAELLPLVATVHPGIDGPPNESGVRDLEVAAGVHLVSRCDRDGCEGTLESAGNPREAPRDDLRFSPADVVEIRHDARHDLWMASAVRSHPGVDWMCLGRKGPELDDLHLLTVSDADVAGRFGPSRGWLVGAALGVMIALLALARGRREHARLRDLAGAVEARLDDGWLVFDDGAAPVRAPDDIVGRGSVVVRVAGRQGGAAYRVADRREVEVVAPGTLDRLQHALRLEAARHDALALGALALLVAPLVASALLGFLG